METLRADYLVVGAGPAGATAARLLALKGREVILADAGGPTETRLELLAPASLASVAAVGLEPLLDDPAVARRCLGIRRTRGSGDQEYEDFLRHPHRIGYVVDRAQFDRLLRAAAIDAGVIFHTLRATDIGRNGGVIFRESVSGAMKRIDADVVVDATGRASAIGRRRGARVTVRDRRIAELVEDIDTHPYPDASWLDYRSDGSSWSYRIVGPGGRAQTWRIHTDRTRASDVLRTVDASASLRSKAAGPGWIAVGDAAIAFDPIASQGLFNALSSALIATGAVLSANQLRPSVAKAYSDAMTATFLITETGRGEIYRGRAPAKRQPAPRSSR